MGNYRFRLSDMMPNAWFYKLRDMSRAKNQNPAHAHKKKQSTSTRSKSFYNSTTTTIESSITVDKLFASPKNTKSFDTRFPYDPPRRSSKKRVKRKTIYMPSPRKNATRTSDDEYVIQERDHADGFPVWLKASTSSTSPEEDFQESESNGYDSFDSLCKLSSSATDIIIDVDEISYSEMHVVDRSTAASSLSFDMVSELELPPILTRPKKLQNDPSKPVKFPKENYNNIIEPKKTSGRKSISRSGGVKIRGNGAKIGSKKSETRRRKSSVKSCEKINKGLFGSESFAIVKASFDPEKDFRDSMMEMIVENNIRTSKDLEELLACYLSLNSNQYHDLIIKAFEQIWFNMHQLQL